MFTLIGQCLSKQNAPKSSEPAQSTSWSWLWATPAEKGGGSSRLSKIGLLLDLAGLVTLLVLGALSIHSLGGDLITSLNSVPFGGYAMIAGALPLATMIVTLYLLNKNSLCDTFKCCTFSYS